MPRCLAASLAAVLSGRAGAAPHEDRRRGHLQPLGANRPPDGAPLEFHVDQLPTAEQFWRLCVVAMQPCVLRGAGTRSDAFRRWSTEYLREVYGGVDVKREWRIENRSRRHTWSDGSEQVQPPRIKLVEFLGSSEVQEDFYVVSIPPDAMLAEVAVPPCVLCGGRKWSNKRLRERQYSAAPPWLTQIQEADLWVSMQPTSSLIHYDSDQNMNCLFRGEKLWRFYDTRRYHRSFPWQEGDLYDPKDPLATRGSDSLKIDVRSVDLERYPDWDEVRYNQTIQHEGDCIFIPFSYVHQVQSVRAGLTAAISYMWLRRESFDEVECARAPAHEFIPLQHFDYVWYFNGSGVIPIGYPDAAGVRRHVRGLAKEGLGVDVKKFERSLLGALGGCSLGKTPRKERSRLAQHHFELLDTGPRDGVVTVAEVDAAPMEAFVSLAIASDDGEEVNFLEPYHSRPESLRGPQLRSALRDPSEL